MDAMWLILDEFGRLREFVAYKADLKSIEIPVDPIDSALLHRFHGKSEIANLHRISRPRQPSQL